MTKRNSFGYGSTYQKGDGAGIRSVLGGQKWTITPDKLADVDNPCLWMASGVVKYKDCNNFFDCPTCRYDSAMLKSVENGKNMSWQDMMRRLPELDRICRHSLTERIDDRLCAYDYRCDTCDFDQVFEDFMSPKTPTGVGEVQNIKGFDVLSFGIHGDISVIVKKYG